MNTYTPKQAAFALQCSTDTVRLLIASKALAALNIGSGKQQKPRWRITESALRSFMAMRRNRLLGVLR